MVVGGMREDARRAIGAEARHQRRARRESLLRMGHHAWGKLVHARRVHARLKWGNWVRDKVEQGPEERPDAILGGQFSAALEWDPDRAAGETADRTRTR